MRERSYRYSDRRYLFHLIIDNTLKRTNENYAWSFPVTVTFIRTNTWHIMLFQKQAGNTAGKSVPETSIEIASFCSDFNTRDIKFRACSRAKSKLNFSIRVRHLSLCPARANVRMTLKWHIWLVIDCWSLTAPIRNSVRGRTEFCVITMTSGRHNLHFPTPNPLLNFDRRPPPWYKFLSLPNRQLPLKSKMAAMILVKEILGSRSPKLRQLCRLTITRYRLLFFNYKWYIPFRKHQKESYNSWREFRLTHLLRWSIDYYSWQVSGINFESKGV